KSQLHKVSRLDGEAVGSRRLRQSQLIASAGRRVQVRRTSGTWFRMMTRVGGAQYTSRPARGTWAHSIAEQRKLPHSVRIVSGENLAPPAWVRTGNTPTKTTTRTATNIDHRSRPARRGRRTSRGRTMATTPPRGEPEPGGAAARPTVSASYLVVPEFLERYFPPRPRRRGPPATSPRRSGWRPEAQDARTSSGVDHRASAAS